MVKTQVGLIEFSLSWKNCCGTVCCLVTQCGTAPKTHKFLWKKMKVLMFHNGQNGSPKPDGWLPVRSFPQQQSQKDFFFFCPMLSVLINYFLTGRRHSACHHNTSGYRLKGSSAWSNHSTVLIQSKWIAVLFNEMHLDKKPWTAQRLESTAWPSGVWSEERASGHPESNGLQSYLHFLVVDNEQMVHIVI